MGEKEKKKTNYYSAGQPMRSTRTLTHTDRNTHTVPSSAVRESHGVRTGVQGEGYVLWRPLC